MLVSLMKDAKPILNSTRNKIFNSVFRFLEKPWEYPIFAYAIFTPHTD